MTRGPDRPPTEKRSAAHRTSKVIRATVSFHVKADRTGVPPDRRVDSMEHARVTERFAVPKILEVRSNPKHPASLSSKDPERFLPPRSLPSQTGGGSRRVTLARCVGRMQQVGFIPR
jgi:hypothetical protein